MNNTSRMVRLLEAVRRQRNGEVADTMRYYGAKYGLNYGVSLPTLRDIARGEGVDHAFARFLYLQDVRELRLAAFLIADPRQITVAEASFWGKGIVNSEMAEEVAFALLGRVECFGELFDAWTEADQPLLLQYAALLGAARNPGFSVERLERVAEVVRRNPDDRLTAQGAIALLVALGQKEENRPAVFRTIGSLGTSPSADLIHEETTWRLEA